MQPRVRLTSFPLYFFSFLPVFDALCLTPTAIEYNCVIDILSGVLTQTLSYAVILFVSQKVKRSTETLKTALAQPTLPKWVVKMKGESGLRRDFYSDLNVHVWVFVRYNMHRSIPFPMLSASHAQIRSLKREILSLSWNLM